MMIKKSFSCVLNVVLQKIQILIILIIIIAPELVGLADENLLITHGPYLVDPAENSITIVWFTNKKCVSWVEYCSGENYRTFPTWGGIAQRAMNSHHGLVDGYSRIHRVRLTGLKPGENYKYRLLSKEIMRFKPYEVLFGDTIASDINQFKTLNTLHHTFSFGIVSDGHERYAKLDTLFQRMSWDGVDLMFLNGDMLNWLEDDDQIFTGFIDVSVNRFAKEIPIIYIRGNHETRGGFARDLMTYFPNSSGRFYYSFSHGPVHFIILDSGEDKPDSHPVYAGLVDFDRYREEQVEWLKEDINSASFKKALYRVVFFHIPPFTESNRHGAQHVTDRWGPILNEAGIDLMFNGHTHRYAYIKPIAGRNNFPIVIVGADTILKVNVSMKQLDLAVINRDGEIIESFSVLPKR